MKRQPSRQQIAQRLATAHRHRCEKLGRRCIVIEQSAAYCEVIARRLADPPLLEAIERQQQSWLEDAA